MNAPAPTREEKTMNGLLLAVLFVAGVVMVREGPHFDNVIDGWPFFTSAFFGGTLIGYLCWTYTFGVKPALKFAGAYRQQWLAALVMGLATTVSVSYINRTFAAPADRYFTAPLDSIDEGKGGRWLITVKTADGRFQRYLVTKEIADALKSEKMINIGIARGALGFDLMATFEPVKR